MTERTQTELYVYINQDGNVTADEDQDAARDRMELEYGGDQCRLVLLTLDIPLPVTTEVKIVLPEEVAGEPKVTVVQTTEAV